MEIPVQKCKYCSNFRVAVYGPMNSGYCRRKEFEIAFNEKQGIYERKIVNMDISGSANSDNKLPCENFKPIMSTNTQEWFQEMFK
ncbi:MAG: hypothetical protein KAR38_01030 [Calditrichia bacterium]|nr:hypothetical protein [Calditrichia bacterium]